MTVNAVEVVCGEHADACICGEPPNHEGPHSCPCGGSWNGVFETDTFWPVSMPGTSGTYWCDGGVEAAP